MAATVLIIVSLLVAPVAGNRASVSDPVKVTEQGTEASSRSRLGLALQVRRTAELAGGPGHAQPSQMVQGSQPAALAEAQSEAHGHSGGSSLAGFHIALVKARAPAEPSPSDVVASTGISRAPGSKDANGDDAVEAALQSTPDSPAAPEAAEAVLAHIQAHTPPGVDRLSPAVQQLRHPRQEARLGEETWSFIYGGTVALTLAGVVLLYGSRGPGVVLRITAYLLALSVMTISVKLVLTRGHFPFPKFISSVHFLCCGLLGALIMMLRWIFEGRPLFVPKVDQFCFMVLPIALAFATSIAANNQALAFAGAGFVEMVGGSTPLCVVLIKLMQGMRFEQSQAWAALAVCAGVALCATGEMAFSTVGFALALFASFSRAVRATLQSEMMEAQRAAGNGQCMDPVELLAWTSLPSAPAMLLWSMLSPEEGLEPVHRLLAPLLASAAGLTAAGTVGRAADGLGHISPSSGVSSAAALRSSGELYLLLTLTCANACVLNTSNLFVVRDLGPVGAQLASQLKGILTVLGGVALLRESVSPVQIGGFAMVLVGVFFYNWTDAQLKEAAAAACGKDTLRAAEACARCAQAANPAGNANLPAARANTSIFGPQKWALPGASDAAAADISNGPPAAAINSSGHQVSTSPPGGLGSWCSGCRTHGDQTQTDLCFQRPPPLKWMAQRLQQQAQQQQQQQQQQQLCQP